MAIQPIDIGAAPNDGTGDPLRTSFDKVNGNFTDVDGRITALDNRTSNVDNTADVDKPISNAVQTALDGKEDDGTAAAAAAAAVAVHESAVDPHPQYATPAEAAAVAPVQSVAGHTGNVVLGVEDIDGLVGVLGGARNRLVNGKFRVNQRGYVSGAATTSANQYTLDCWRVVVSGQSVTFSAAGNGNVVIAPAGGYEQVIEGANIEGGVYTLSWTGTATATVNGAVITNGGQTTALPANANVTVRFSGGTVAEAQFEPGSIATPFEQRQISQELSLCHRYCRVFQNGANAIAIASGQCASATNAAFVIQGLNLRAIPTLTVSGTLAISAANGSLLNATSYILGSLTSTAETIHISVDVASGLVAGNSTRLFVNANSKLILDAGL